MIDKIRAWVTLVNTPNISNKKALEIVDFYGSPKKYVGKKQIFSEAESLLSASVISSLETPELTIDWDKIQKLIESHNIKFVTFLDDDYPTPLKSIYNPPLFFFYRGKYNPNDFRRSIAVVGTRKPSNYGKTMTKKIVKNLVKQNCVICSGLAYGVDAISHKTTLDNGGKTYAIMATGCDRIYPAENKDIAKRILENGAVISEFLPGAKVEKWNFPIRNRIISALSLGTFVVEGKKNSGAMLTAKYALEQNKDIYALPGDVDREQAQGPNYLIKLGAKLVSSAEDILEEYDFVTTEDEQTSFFPELSEDEHFIYQILLENKPEIIFDNLLIKSQSNVSQLSSILFSLEIKGVIRRNPGNKISALI